MSDTHRLVTSSANNNYGRGTAALDPALLEALGPPALLEGESIGAYKALYDRIRSAVRPADVIEELWVRDMVDLVWDTLRLRRWKSKLMTSAADEGLQQTLTPHLGYNFSEDSLVKRWAGREPKAIKRVDQLLKQIGADRETIVARTFLAKLASFERIDALIAQTEARRNAVIREIDRRRESFARRLGTAVNEIADAEFEEVGQNEATA